MSSWTSSDGQLDGSGEVSSLDLTGSLPTIRGLGPLSDGSHAERLGVADSPSPAPKVDDVPLRAPRIRPPAPLAPLCSAAPYERLLHTYGKSFPDAVRAFARDFEDAPDLVARPRSEADVLGILDWAADANAA